MRFFLLLFVSFSFSNNLILESSIDTDTAYVGDVFLWSVIAEGDSIHNIKFPELEFESDSITIKEQGFIKNNEIIKGRYFYLTAWDTGVFFTPEYYITLLNSDNSIKSKLKTEKLKFTIKSILFDEKTEDFRPTKGPVPIKDFLGLKLLSLSLVVLVISYLLFLIFRKRKKNIYLKKNYVKPKNPKKIALERIKLNKTNKLVKDFYTDLSHISRKYIEDKYFIRTLEMTTIQIKSKRDLFQMNDKDFSFWVSFLDKADRVKYSKEIFSIEEMEKDKNNITNWLEDN